ncbi:MAG: UxaA family hydrolase [Lachnospiraceae bacterium]|nr:UxaA family hydrolase [Lachnospiraceae bacterium]
MRGIMEQQSAFQINETDNVATALQECKPGKVQLLGDCTFPYIEAVTDIPLGHKIALRDISTGESIIKYGVVIGRSTGNIPKGSWVHLHVMESIYDQRSSHLDAVTGAPKDTQYI